MVEKNNLESLLNAVGDARSILILPHNDPDPDAIASAMALRYLLAEKLGIEGRIAYKGIIGRAENRAMVRYLGRPLRRLESSDLRTGEPIALIDTQPGAGNNALPPKSIATIVIDHHPWREATSTATLADVRSNIGATSTIMTEYLQNAGLEPTPSLATALFYGIKTDTLGLGRGARPTDVAAYFYLQTRIDVDALVEIERAQVPANYFKSFHATLESTCLYQNVAISHIGPMSYPDMAAEMADLLLRLEGAQWVICTGVYQDTLILAVRTRSRQGGAGTLVQNIVGDQGTSGGHGTMAGGQIPLRGEDPMQVASQLSQRSLKHLKVAMDAAASPLIS